MQTILYHNGSGSEAFTGNLNQKEVHRAITLHPIKDPIHLYRLHVYLEVTKMKKKTNLQNNYLIIIILNKFY